MPTPKIFIDHFLNVVDVYNSNGKKKLFDAKGNPVPKKETKDIALHLLKNRIRVYERGMEGASAYLDAYFEKDLQNNKFKFYSAHRAEKDSKGNKTLFPKKIQDLEECLMKMLLLI